MKKLLTMLLVLIMVATTAACQNQVTEDEAETVVPQQTETVSTEAPSVATTEAEQASEEAYYPVSITTHNRSKEELTLTFDQRPEKVVAVYQNSIETLIALGAEDVIVAAAGLDHEIKPMFKSAFDSLNYYDQGLAKEEIMGLSPDFILSWYSFFGEKQLGDVDFWHDRGVNTYMMTNSGAIEGNRTLENEYTDIRNLGVIFNAVDEAEQIIADIQGALAEGKGFAAGKEPVRAILIESKSDGTFRVYGENSVGGDMAKEVGADLVAKESGTIGAEDLVALNPDVIFTVYYAYFGGATEEDEAMGSILNNEGLANLSAIQNKRILPVKLGEVYCSGVRTIDGVETMLRGLYPDDYDQ